MQTVKTNGAGGTGLFERGEWELPVAGDEPVLDARTPLPSLVGADDLAEIAPAFAVDVVRRTWSIQRGSARVELVLDRGDASAADRTTPLCEIELELKDGSPEGLFAFARLLGTVAPLRLGVLSKAERGYRLLGPAPTVPVKAEPIALDRKMTAAAGFQAIASACLRQFRLNEIVLADARDAGALHQARVALRRLRSAFAIFKAIVADSHIDRLRAEVKWLAGELGTARNLDVLIERIGDRRELRKELAPAREETYAAVEATLASQRARALLLDLAQWVAVGEWMAAPSTAPARAQMLSEQAAAALHRYRKKVKRHGRHLAERDDAARHRLRKSAKKLRYASNFFAGLVEGKKRKRRHARYLDALETLQDQLGALNDVATAPHVLARHGLRDSAAARRFLASDDRSALIAAAADAHDALIDTKRFWR